MITYKTLNTNVIGNELVVFFEFSNGEINSNKFPLTTTIMDIQKWAIDRAKFFEQRELEIQELQKQVIEELPLETNPE